MAARTGMTSLIAELRSMTEAGTADYTVAGTTYWTDDQVQDELDRTREDVYDYPLSYAERTDSGGTARYYDYYFEPGWWEEVGGGTAVWIIQDSDGSTVGTANYTVNYYAGHVRFTADQAGTSYYLTGKKYNLNRAASNIWRRKAAHVANRYDWKTDGHDMKPSQERKHYLEMSQFYTRESGGRLVRLARGDTT